MEHKIIRFEPLKATEEMWEAYHGLQDKFSLELNPEDPLLPRPTRRAMLESSEAAPFHNKYHFLMLAPGGEACGYAFVYAETTRSPSYHTNKATATMELSVLPEFRLRGLGTALYRHMSRHVTAREPQVKEFLCAVLTEPGSRFAQRLGGKMSLEQAENRLWFKELDWTMVENWAAKGAAANPATKALTITAIPDEDLVPLAELFSEVLNQQPMGEIDVTLKIAPEQLRLREELDRKNGGETILIYAKEADGSISGLTDMGYHPDRPYRATQMFTGVRASCRGRGLGKLLKALMLLHLRASHPEIKYVTTANAPSNGPMMAINNALGFRKHRGILLYKLPA